MNALAAILAAVASLTETMHAPNARDYARHTALYATRAAAVAQDIDTVVSGCVSQSGAIVCADHASQSTRLTGDGYALAVDAERLAQSAPPSRYAAGTLALCGAVLTEARAVAWLASALAQPQPSAFVRRAYGDYLTAALRAGHAYHALYTARFPHSHGR